MEEVPMMVSDDDEFNMCFSGQSAIIIVNKATPWLTGIIHKPHKSKGWYVYLSGNGSIGWKAICVDYNIALDLIKKLLSTTEVEESSGSINT